MATQNRLRQRLSSKAVIKILNILYKIRRIKIFGEKAETVLCPAEGSENLVALCNSLCILSSVTFKGETELSEEALMTFITLTLSRSTEIIKGIPDEVLEKIGFLLGNIRTDFSLQPCLSGNYDFHPTSSSDYCHALGLPLLHGWVVDPEVPIYETIKRFNYEQLLEYRNNLGEGEHRAICDDLLNAAKNQLTAHGLSGLYTELGILAATEQMPVALLYWCGKWQVILLKEGDLFIYVADEAIVREMPDALYMLFEEGQQENIYFDRAFEPIPGQQFEVKAKEWMENKKKAKQDEKKRKKKEKRKNAKEKALSDVKVLPGAAGTSEGDQPKDDQNAKSKFQSDELVTGLPPQQDQDLPVGQGYSDDTAADSVQEMRVLDEQSKGDHNAKNKIHSDEQVTGLPPQQDQDLPAVQASSDDTEMKVLEEQSKGDQNAKNKFRSDEQVTSLPPQQDQDLPARQGSLDDAAADLIQELNPLGQGLVAQQELKSSDEYQDDYEQGVPAASGNVVSPHADSSLSHEDVQHKKDDDLLDNDPFFKFLTNFKERGSSGPYFKGMVAAFATHRPFFYVPYEFIMAHDEKLALKIQDNIASISKDLDKIVVYYLKKNGVESPDDAKTKITDLPPPKWLAS